jgi:glutamate-1-semialdehyde 2,1-aminomutase
MMTNIGMVPVAPGYHEALHRLTQETQTLLITDETDTICAGPGGCTALYALKPDMIVIGKALSGGIPSAVYGTSDAIRREIEARASGPGSNHNGFGGTLAANALTMRAMRVTLEQIMTDATYERMTRLAVELERLIGQHLREFALPWHVSRVGSRVEYLYRPTPPRNGGEAAAARNDEIGALIHLYFLNCGILLTPFHNMTLISAYTTDEDIVRFGTVFVTLLAELVSAERTPA